MYNWTWFGVLDPTGRNIPTRWHIVPWTGNLYTLSQTFAQAFSSFSSICAFFHKRCIHGCNCKDAIVGLDLDQKQWVFNTTVCTLEEDHATVQAQIFRYDRNYLLFHHSIWQLGKRAHFFHLGCWWRTRLPIAVPANRSARRVPVAVYCAALISQAWLRSACVISALRSARRRLFCSQFIRASSVF